MKTSHAKFFALCLMAGVTCQASDLDARHAAAMNRVRTFVYNTDGCDMLYYPKSARVNVDAFVGQRLGYVRDTRISTVSYCPLSSGFGWFTLLGVGDPLTNTVDETSERVNATLAFAAIGHDCLEMAMGFCKERGMERFLSIRMNDSHDGSSRPHEGKFHPLFSTFRRQHPECLMGDPSKKEFPEQCAWQWTCVDYSHAAVQDHVRTFIRQFCDKYDMEGIELDFCRHPKYFKRCSYGGVATDAERATMTALLADIRAIVREAEIRRNSPILLHARVPDSIEYCRDIGLDVAAWLENGLLDGVIGGCYFNLNDWKTTADFVHSHGVKFYASIDESRIPGSCRRWNRRCIPGRDTLANYCASYAQVMSAGCDGVYLFNLEHERLRDFTQFDPRDTDGLDKIYFATQRGKGGYEPTHYLKNGYRYKKLPYIDPAADPKTVLKDKSGLHDPGLDFAEQYRVDGAREFELRIGDDFARAAEKGLRPRITVMALATELSAPDASFTVNGHALGNAEFKDGLFTFANVPAAHVVKGVNRFGVAPFAKPFVLNDFAVKIEYSKSGNRRMMKADDYEMERPDGRTARTAAWALAKLRANNPPAPRPYLKDAATFLAWRDKVRDEARRRLGEMDENPEFRLLEERRREGYMLKTYEFYPFEGLAVKTMVLVPDSAKAGATPVVVCMPGSSGSLECLAGEPDPYTSESPVYPLRNRQAWWYAKCGMIGVALENVGNANNAADDLVYWKSQLKARELLRKCGAGWDDYVTSREIASVINFLKRDNLVDCKRIAVSGLSLGAIVARAALVNDDIAACVYNDFAYSAIQRLGATTVLPAGASHGGNAAAENMLALAPKPLLLNEGGAWKGLIEDIAKAYELLGHAGNLSVHYYDRYADPAKRIHESEDLRGVTGLTPQQYFEYSNVDPDDHSFHAESALPWLCRLFFGKWEPTAELAAEIEKARAERPRKLEELFPPDGLGGRKCAPLRDEFTDADFVPERADGRTEKSHVWAKMWLERILRGKHAAVAPKFAHLETRRRAGYTVEVYEFYPDELLAVKTMFLIPDGAAGWKTPVEVCWGRDGESVEMLAGEFDPHGRAGASARALAVCKTGKMAVALARPGEAGGSWPDVSSADSRARYLALLSGSGWTDEKLVRLEEEMCVDFIKGLGVGDDVAKRGNGGNRQ